MAVLLKACLHQHSGMFIFKVHALVGGGYLYINILFEVKLFIAEIKDSWEIKITRLISWKKGIHG